ncbi:MAG: hypothetical protein JNL21_34665 [Myxococcales bacterium]|nr:hypothetical protein [Myxococcales bacterium]
MPFVANRLGQIDKELMEGLRLEIETRCERCNATVGVNRLGTSLHCHACDSTVGIDPAELSAALEIILYEARRLAPREALQQRVRRFRVRMSREVVSCPRCRGALRASVGTPAVGGVTCNSCKTLVPTRSSWPGLSMSYVETSIGEDAEETGGSQGDALPAAFPCSHCGAPLQLDGSELVRCRHCSTTTHVPKAFLRRGLRPVAEPFHLVGSRLFEAPEGGNAATQGLIDWYGPVSVAVLAPVALVVAGHRKAWAPLPNGEIEERVERFVLGLDAEVRTLFRVSERVRRVPVEGDEPPEIALRDGVLVAFGSEGLVVPIVDVPVDVDVAGLRLLDQRDRACRVKIEAEELVPKATGKRVRLSQGKPRKRAIYLWFDDLVWEIMSPSSVRCFGEDGTLRFDSAREPAPKKLSPEQAAKRAGQMVMARALERAAKEQEEADVQNAAHDERIRAEGLRILKWTFGGIVLFGVAVALLVAMTR